MKKLLNAFSKEKLQKVLFLGLIVLVFGVFVVSIIVGGTNQEESPEPDGIEDPGEENNDPIEPTEPNPKLVVEKYLAPCDTTKVSIMRHFYSLDADTATQEMSLIQYGNKYFISRGVTYKNENNETFDVKASLSGTVSDIVASSVYGNTITIDHGDGIKTEYIGVSDVKVEIGDVVEQGSVIATSGTAEYDTAASNHLHFRISVNDTYYDPEKLINTNKEVE